MDDFMCVFIFLCPFLCLLCADVECLCLRQTRSLNLRLWKCTPTYWEPSLVTNLHRGRLKDDCSHRDRNGPTDGPERGPEGR